MGAPMHGPDALSPLRKVPGLRSTTSNESLEFQTLNQGQLGGIPVLAIGSAADTHVSGRIGLGKGARESQELSLWNQALAAGVFPEAAKLGLPREMVVAQSSSISGLAPQHRKSKHHLFCGRVTCSAWPL